MTNLIGITLQRYILYTLASFGSHYSPKLPIYAYVCKLLIQTLSTYVGELMLPIQVMKLVHILYI
jgi:hypothetical protein